MIAHGSATWAGTWHAGSGALKSGSGSVAGVGYTYASRFELTDGTSPEELLATAYAGYLNQALANTLGWGNFVADHIETTVEVETVLGQHDAPPGRIHVSVRATVPRIEESQFAGLANAARAGCLVGRLLTVPTSMDARLVP